MSENKSKLQSKVRETHKADKVKTATKKAKSSSELFWTTNRKFLVVVIIFVGLVVSIPLIANYNQRLAGQDKIEAYLEDKYKRDFIVGVPVREASGFGVEGYLQSEAYPEDNSSLKFRARTSSGGTSDSYPSAIWKEQEKPIVESKLKEIFGYLPSYSLEIYSMNTFNSRVSGASIPSIDEIAILYPGELPYTLRIQADQPFSGEAKNDAANKLYEIVKYVQSKHASATIQYIYKDVGTNTNSGWSLDSNELDGAVTINNTDDLINNYETWRAR